MKTTSTPRRMTHQTECDSQPVRDGFGRFQKAGNVQTESCASVHWSISAKWWQRWSVRTNPSSYASHIPSTCLHAVQDGVSVRHLTHAWSFTKNPSSQSVQPSLVFVVPWASVPKEAQTWDDALSPKESAHSEHPSAGHIR